MTRSRTAASAAAGLALLIVLAGCSGEETPPATTTPSTTAAPPTTTELPLTPEDEAEAAALAVFEAYDAIEIASAKQPGAKDWEPDIRQFAGDPFASAAVRQLRENTINELAADGTRASTVLSTDVSLEQPPTVTLMVCVDETDWDVIYVPTGEVLETFTETGDPPPDRYTQTFVVQHYEAEPGAPWLISGGEILLDRPC